MRLIYGSEAIKYWLPSFYRKPNDIDYISNEGQTHNGGEEFYWIDEFEYILKNNKDEKYVDLNFIYTIKLSHLSYDINFDKHMKDVIFMKKHGCEIDGTLYKSLMKAWSRIHGPKKVKINGENEQFFKGNVYRKYDHDWLHLQYAIHGRPMNERIRLDLNSPKCYEHLWSNLSYSEKLDMAVEELYVLTSERYIFIEKPLPIKHAKVKTLKNMIVSTTSGWFNLFLKTNFEELLNYCPDNIINKIKTLGLTT